MQNALSSFAYDPAVLECSVSGDAVLDQYAAFEKAGGEFGDEAGFRTFLSAQGLDADAYMARCEFPF